MEKKIWLVTGVSSGLGKAMTEAIIEHGDFVIGTLRESMQVKSFNDFWKEKAFALKVDITQAEGIEELVRTIRETYGRVDVLVNNAGFGFAGAIEESSLVQVRAVFEANFYGTLSMTQSILPLMREKRKGHIIQICSHGGVKAFAGFGGYNASKFAVEGFTEALAAEVAPLGIKVLIVEPGPFRTSFAGHGFKESTLRIAAYQETAGAFRDRIKSVHGKQEGDPAKAANIIIGIVNSDFQGLRLPLGKIAVGTITAKIKSLQDDLDLTRHIAEKAVF